ncbi:hypothetical protein PIB30_038546 [Stylosanthes scabra]|uniref:Uncharacterized protein n=1 Tax=Stylosanthes scabra TaxID=79078 RepID=A0ABU6XBP9_9FABA|nr:hypothetical protein [Stylosanthes scabra]
MQAGHSHRPCHIEVHSEPVQSSAHSLTNNCSFQNLEVVGLKEDNIVFIIDDKNIVDWMLRKIGTSWELSENAEKQNSCGQVSDSELWHMHNGEYKHKKR